MGWIFLVASEESESRLSPGFEQSPIVSESHTLKAFYCPGCDLVTLIGHQSGMMSPPSEPKCCQKLTSSSEDSHAKTCQLRVVERAWQESGVDYSSKSFDLPESADQLSFFSKMSLPYELVEEKQWSKNWPKSGMTVGGLLFQPPQLAPHTKETDGFSWPTPNASDRYNANMKNNHDVKRGYLRGFVQLWPTPTVCGNYQNKGNMIGLATAVRMWPTPRASEYKDCGPVGSKSQAHMEKRNYLCAKAKDPSIPTGQLNPQWVEWLMGYQIGHTELDASATQWFRSKLGRRSKSSQD
jgi:hypothetical protein